MRSACLDTSSLTMEIKGYGIRQCSKQCLQIYKLYLFKISFKIWFSDQLLNCHYFDVGPLSTEFRIDRMAFGQS